VFRRKTDNSRHIFSLDYLLDHLREWERPHRASHRSDGHRGKEHSARN
jgi:hypothetical protein